MNRPPVTTVQLRAALLNFWERFRDSAIGSTSAFGAESPGSSPGPGTKTVMPASIGKTSDNSGMDEALLTVWRQALVEEAKIIRLGEERYSVRRTAKRALAQVDFEWHGQPLRGLEQNPETKSRWAEMARKGAQVMQFLTGGRYLAVVADGKVFHYSPKQK